MNDTPAPPREYRIDDLAHAAGLPVRTVRYYRERRLLPPPRREGRVGYYNDAHLARLRLISRLLDRGHTLDGVSELLTAWEKGRGVAELLGLESAVAEPWADTTPVHLSWEELSRAYAGQVDEATLRRAQELGYVRVDDDGGGLTHLNRRLLASSSALVNEGIPLTAILDASQTVQRRVDDLATLFVDLVRRHILTDTAQPRSAEEVAHLSATAQRLRPLAESTVLGEFERAMDRRMNEELDTILAELDTSEPPSPH
ncbi:MerR family transcriptional regulator [Salinactinospora qingdaonensis]|uniref:MerR family transcriptional regulator n=1 Tax=Salinactinospora qingdaonensis TaxID=702744 RepID=UPI0031E63585